MAPERNRYISCSTFLKRIQWAILGNIRSIILKLQVVSYRCVYVGDGSRDIKEREREIMRKKKGRWEIKKKEKEEAELKIKQGMVHLPQTLGKACGQ